MGRRSASEPSVTRERILAAAAEEFRRHGYDRTKLSDVGRALGVSGAALYYHFSSKEEILFAYLEAALEAVLDATQAAMTATDPEQRLRQLVHTYVLFGLGALPGADVFAAGVFGYFQLFEALEAEHAALLNKMQRRYLDLLRETIKDGNARGVFSCGAVTEMAFAIVGMCVHAPHWHRPGGDRDARDLAELYADAAVRMVRAG